MEQTKEEKRKVLMKNYHENPENKAKAKERRNTPEQKKRDSQSSKKWRESAAGIEWMKKYRNDNRKQVRASCRKYYHKNKDVKVEYNTKYSEGRQNE